MKKILILACFLFVAGSLSIAQNGRKLGVMGAFNYSTTTTPDKFQSSNVEELNWKAGYKAGLIADIPLGAALSIQPSLLFSSKGYEVTYGDANANLELSAAANYIEFPLLIAFKIPISDNFKLGIHGGPYAAYGVGGKTTLTGNAGSFSGNVDWNTFKGDDQEGISISAMEKFDWGISVGAALEMGKFRFSLNYDHGLQSIYDVDNDDNKIYNYGVWAGLGIYF